MANQWNAVLATQTVAFRGISQHDTKFTASEFPSIRAVENAVYGLRVAGGVSGSFGVLVLGMIGGFTYFLAGITAVSAAGSYVIRPMGYSSNGAALAVPTTESNEVQYQLTNILPPSQVVFQSGVTTAGISANCTVSAALYGSR